MLKQNQQNQPNKTGFPGQLTGIIRVLIKRPELEGGVQLRLDLFPNEYDFTMAQRQQGEQHSPRTRRRSNRAFIHPESVQLSIDLFPDETIDD